jgi:hypothetical protein
MLHLLFAVSAHAQYVGYGANFGTGTPVPKYTDPSSSAPLPPSEDYEGPTLFALRQADRNVWVNQADLNGNRMYLTFDTSIPGVDDADLPFTYSPPIPGLATAFLADSAALQERYYQNEIDYIRATTPVLTREDRNKIDDFALQRDYAYNTKLRRGVGLVPTLQLPGELGPFSSIFDVRAKNAGWVLAQNKLTDARQAYQADPIRKNYIALQNARDGVEQADHRQDASSYDLLGDTYNGASRFGGVFRKKASETKLQIGLRNLRVARENYVKDPSEENWYALRLADLYVRATEEEDETNKNEITFGLLAEGLGTPGDLIGLIWNNALISKNSEDESRLWLKHARLEREQLQRERARALQSGASPVAAQLLGMSMYGPRQGPF